MPARTTPTSNATPRLVRAKVAARDIIGIPYTTLRDVSHRGELPKVMVGSAWYLERSDIERWIESRKERG